MIGTLLSYHTQLRGNLYFLHTVERLDMPLELARDDILFLHHAIELIYFCAPFSSAAPEIFALLYQLYQPSPVKLAADFKIAYLFKLLITLGMHPEESQFHDPFYYLLAREPIDTIIKKSIHLDIKQALHEWVRACVLVHPLIHAFKTVHFLDVT